MRKAILIALTVLFMTSCGAMQMTVSDIKLELYPPHHHDAETFRMAHPDDCGILLGTINPGESIPGTFVVVAFPADLVNTKPADFTVLPGVGPYMLYVPPGRYCIVAFEDFNNNRVCDQNELVGRLETPAIVIVEGGEVIGDLDLTVGEHGTHFLDFPIDVRLSAPVRDATKTVDYDAVVSLDEAFFSKEYGSTGLWSSSRFIDEIGVNIYGLDHYDKEKIPILFVHGSGGTPRDWNYLSRKIDRKLFQPWFFYYPTGLPLETTAALMYEKLSQLHAIHGFSRLCVTAHSMGGLVVRSFLNRHAFRNPPYSVTLFVSISTPWGGVERAELAPDKNLFKGPPVWKDLVPGSPFLKRLYRHRLPPGVTYYLFFGYKGNNVLVKKAGDGVISLDSQLDPAARLEAAKEFGFNENHSGILSSEAVLERYMGILSSVAHSERQ
ncbi:MAG: hypothetical protein JXR85_07805 [Deltaproteobacteria bacterium]|nr:hypothetical protein [Deltaproteobacteria bacterium]